MGDLYEMLFNLWEGAVNYFGSFGELDIWVGHFVIYFLAGLAAWWIFSFAIVRIMKFKQKMPEIGVWLASMTGLVIVGLLTALLSAGIAFFAKKEGGSCIYSVGYGVIVLVCFFFICILHEKINEKCTESEKMLKKEYGVKESRG